jgi:hypothetical protein
VNDDALHVKLGKQFSHDFFAGPSGNFDVKKAVLACIVWMI